MLSASWLSVLLLAAAPPAAAGVISCDADSDCFYVPAGAAESTMKPALVILSCVGAESVDLDTCRRVGDSLGWILATCHRTRNHQRTDVNDQAIVRTIDKLLAAYPVDPYRVFLFGFSGQGVQALSSMFSHPELIRGVVSVCPHAGALPLATWEQLRGHLVYLVTRERDWNRRDCEEMYRLFNTNGLASELAVTKGEHGPRPCAEVLSGCRWLAGESR